MDLAAAQEGSVVILTTSEDERQPGENVNTGAEDTFWMSTGCFPQEIVVQLANPQRISKVKVTGTCLRKLRAEGCSAETPSTFAPIGETELELPRTAALQSRDFGVQQLPGGEPVRFLKLVIASGWYDFVSVHSFQCFA